MKLFSSFANCAEIRRTMEEFEKVTREEVYTKSVRAGKRTYFFDVKEMRSGEKFITVTESRKKFNQATGRFFYEKHKIFLYKEDFDKFSEGLEAAVQFIRTGIKDDSFELNSHENFDFNLGNEDGEIL